MKKKLLFSLICVGTATFTYGQQIYMATGQENTNYINFKEVKTLDVTSFDEASTLFSKVSLLNSDKVNSKTDCNCDPASLNYIAAVAVDNNENIFTINMLGTKIFKQSANGDITTFDVSTNSKWTEQDLFARMTSTPDGSVYLLNNAGSQLIKISSDNTITKLGAVTGFDELFKSFTDMRSSYGGDMIADENGNLFVITAFANVVKIDLATMSAEFIGQISGLPEGYTVNGTAVLDNNNVLLASSKPAGFYVTDPSLLKATYFGANGTPTYDLASKNFLKTNPTQTTESSLAVSPTLIKDERFFNIVATDDINNNSTVALYSVDGKMIMNQAIVLKSGNNKININNAVPGVYVVKVTDANGKVMLNSKVSVH